MIESNVQAKRLAASGEISPFRARIKGVYLVPGAGAGSVAIRNGGASGTILCTLDTTAGGSAVYVHIPSAGVFCTESAYADITAATSATFFYA
jgi:hypothetical protein